MISSQQHKSPPHEMSCQVFHDRSHYMFEIELLSHLHYIDAFSKVVYGMLDVARSTLWGLFNNKNADLPWSTLFVCANTAISLLQAYFLDHLSVTLDALVDGELESWCIETSFWIIWDLSTTCLRWLQFGYLHSAMSSKATGRLQTF